MKTYMIRILYIGRGKSQRYEDTIRLAYNYTKAFNEAIKHSGIPDDKIQEVLIHELRH